MRWHDLIGLGIIAIVMSEVCSSSIQIIKPYDVKTRKSFKSEDVRAVGRQG